MAKNEIDRGSFPSGTAMELNGQIPVAWKPALSCAGVIECSKSSERRDANTSLSALDALVLSLNS